MIDVHVRADNGRSLTVSDEHSAAVHGLRPGDEVRIAWREGWRERSCWVRVVGFGARWRDTGAIHPAPAGWSPRPRIPGARFWDLCIVGRTTHGRNVTAHEHWITDVRPEQDEALRQSWAKGRAA